MATQTRSTAFYFDLDNERNDTLWWLRTLTTAAQSTITATAEPRAALNQDAAGPQHSAAVNGPDGAIAHVLADTSLDFETDVVGESFDDRPQHLLAIIEYPLVPAIVRGDDAPGVCLT